MRRGPLKSTRLLRAGSAGLVGQVCLSLVSLATVTVSARLLGPAGAGSTAIGLTAYFITLGFQRALLSDPAIAKTSTATSEERRTAAGEILTLSALLGVIGSTSLLLLGLVVASDGATGLLVFAPWIVPALLHDAAKSLLYRDGRAWEGAACDAVWLAGTSLLVVATVFRPSIWSIGLAWGLGAAAGATFGLARLRVPPHSVGESLGKWRTDWWPLGRWLATEGLVYVGSTAAATFMIAGILGVDKLGGLRTAQTLFAPLTILIPAFSIFGLPAVARAHTQSPQHAVRVASALSAATVLIASLYLAAVIPFSRALMMTLFGDEFGTFASLAAPVAVATLAVGAGVGFVILLKVEGRGRALLGTRVVGTIMSLGLIVPCSNAWGVDGAAWALTADVAATSALTLWAALRTPPFRTNQRHAWTSS